MTISKPFKGLANGKAIHENANMYTRVFYGDQNLCEQWITYAQTILTQMLMLPGTQTRHVLATPEVAINVTCRPNRIEINAGGGMQVTLADVTSIDGEYPDNSLPPYQQQSNRFLYLKKVTPTSKVDFYAGDYYWYNKAKTLSVSWKNKTIYYRGKFFTLSNTVQCACLVSVPNYTGKLLAVVTYSGAFDYELRLVHYEITYTKTSFSLSLAFISHVITLPHASSSITYSEFSNDGKTIIFIAASLSKISKVVVSSYDTDLTGALLYEIAQQSNQVTLSYARTASFSGYYYVLSAAPVILCYGGSNSAISGAAGLVHNGIGTILTGRIVENNFYYLYYDYIVDNYTSSSSDSQNTDVASDGGSYDATRSISNSQNIEDTVKILEGYINITTGVNTLNNQVIFSKSFVRENSAGTGNYTAGAVAGVSSYSTTNSSFDSTNKVLQCYVSFYDPIHNVTVLNYNFQTTDYSSTTVNTVVSYTQDVNIDYKVIMCKDGVEHTLTTDNFTYPTVSNVGYADPYVGGTSGPLSFSNVSYTGDNSTVSYTKRSAENGELAVTLSVENATGDITTKNIIFLSSPYPDCMLETITYTNITTPSASQFSVIPVSVTHV